MRSYQTTIDIDASRQHTWRVLTDFAAYPDWNPLVAALDGDLRTGGTIYTTIVPLDNTYKATLLSYREGREIVWRGTRVAGFLLAGRHYYRLHDSPSGGTRLEHGEDFTGLISHFLPAKLLKRMEAAFVAHNEQLKIRVENGE